MLFAPSKSGQRAKIKHIGVLKTRDHIQIKIKVPHPHQELTVSSKAQNEDIMDMDVHCTFNIKIETQNLEHWYIKYQ